MQTVAEKKAWELSKKEGFELATIMPSLVLGPVTGTRPDGTSINAMKVMRQSSLIVYSHLAIWSLSKCNISPMFWCNVTQKKFVNKIETLSAS